MIEHNAFTRPDADDTWDCPACGRTFDGQRQDDCTVRSHRPLVMGPPPRVYTYRTLIRKYAVDVANARVYTDLSPRERRLCVVLLNLAGNSGWAGVCYPPTDQTRDNIIERLADIARQARAFVLAVSPASAEAFENAHAHALVILRSL